VSSGPLETLLAREIRAKEVELQRLEKEFLKGKNEIEQALSALKQVLRSQKQDATKQSSL